MADVSPHGIKTAYYTWADTILSPILECICGLVFSGDNWGEAGEFFDNHLEEVKEK